MDLFLSAPHGYKRLFDMDLYLAGTTGRPYVITDMDLYLVSTNTLHGLCHEKPVDPGRQELTQPGLYILESFYYIEDWMLEPIDKKTWNFMLDSGAFTFMEQKASGVKSAIDSDSMRWDDYVRRYADFIIEHDIDLFFELDIDVVVGLDRVNKLRDALETQTGKRSIPVWHKSRGLENWKQLVKDYEYVAIGGIVSGEIKRHEHKFLHAMCDIAHAERTRVHGLGVSPMAGNALRNYRFDSVDSTNWTMGGRAGHLEIFTGTGLRKVPRPDGTRMRPRETAIHNFREWVKYQRYMKHAGWQMTTSQDGIA